MSAALQKDISEQALQIATNPRVRMSKGQAALLKLMRTCVVKNQPLTYDSVMDVYYNNVRKVGQDYKYVGDWNDQKREWFEYDLMEHYKLQDHRWMYTVKPRVRQWFVTTIGSLVIKGQLIVIPTIELEENS